MNSRKCRFEKNHFYKSCAHVVGWGSWQQQPFKQQALSQKLVLNSECGLNCCMAFQTRSLIPCIWPYPTSLVSLHAFSMRIQVSGLLPSSYCRRVDFSIAGRLLSKTGVWKHHWRRKPASCSSLLALLGPLGDALSDQEGFFRCTWGLQWE